MHALGAPSGARVARPALELAEIVRVHGEALRRARPLDAEQYATLRAIERCRTAALGGHLDVCLACGHEQPSYNSCRDRHCPKCQALAQARWVAARGERLLPTAYFHVVFTLPAELRAVAKLNRRRIFELLLRTASATLLDLGLDERRLGALLGVTSVLHTWTRELAFHPHVHCIVTGGGWSVEGHRWIEGDPCFLFPVHVLGALFRGKFLAGLSALHQRGELHLPGDAPEPRHRDPEALDRLCRSLPKKRWHVYAKPPFGGPEQVVRYLGRYTHRVGLSNRRLISLDARGVTFRTKNGKTKTLDPVVFLSRFVEHVLPKGFVKIRHSGLLAPAQVGTSLAAARASLACSTEAEAHRSAARAPSTANTSARDPVREEPSPPQRVGDVIGSERGDWRDQFLALTGIDVRRCCVCGAQAVEQRPLPAARAPPAEAA
jgi:hypothetical protein